MDTIYPRCCGLDVHSKSVHVCVRLMDAQGRVHEEGRSFGTMTCDLLAMRDWLEQAQVTLSRTPTAPPVSLGRRGRSLVGRVGLRLGSARRRSTRCRSTAAPVLGIPSLLLSLLT